ncbi:MAG: nitric-oxide reductase large subunit, partial [Chromatiales bacterium]
TPYEDLTVDRRGLLQARLKAELRQNTYDAGSGNIVISPERAQAIGQVSDHYVALFGNDLEMEPLREQYAIANGAVPDPAHREALTAFFFWTSWATATERPGSTITYTNNWPHEPLIGNIPAAPTVIWSFVSIILLVGGIGGMVWYYAMSRKEEGLPTPPAEDPLGGLKPTPSMRATTKYFFTVIGLFLAQMTLGAITAHYAVEGHEFYGFALSEILPYSVARTWHTQLGIFWIATAWLATGLYIAPALSGHEPRFQRLGVNLLYGALLFVVVGSLAGEWLGVQQYFDLDINFWLGHQGYEFVDLGRFWQLLLFAGLLIWVSLVGRALWPAFKDPTQSRSLLAIVFLSAVAIGAFYGAGLAWGKHTHLSMVEYWRWWVVHLWVEGFFEVFATAVIALLFARLGLVRQTLAGTAVLFETLIFLSGGILGTLHHLYFAGTTTSVIAVGAVFSALEVVPLALIGFEAYQTYRLSTRQTWVRTYRWPIMFFVAVAFWNLVGAGLLGFLINPPLSLYFVQGLNTTPAHGHAALFGVYGMLGIGLMLFCLRGLSLRSAWDDGLLRKSYWFLNVGLGAMVFLSLVPAGLYQAYHSVTTGMWHARSAEVIHSPVMETLVWARVPGDLVFAIGVLILAWFALKLWRKGEVFRAPAPAADALTGR